MEWLLLLHQIPPKPGYFRAKVLRRLNRLGALPIKNSAYLLPASEATHEDLEWLAREIRHEGGEAWLFRCAPLAGLADETLRERFRALRDADYAGLVQEAQILLDRIRQEDPEALRAEAARLAQRAADLRAIDFFTSSRAAALEAVMTELQRSIDDTGGAAPRGAEPLVGRTWVTRRGVKIDRMASAWLVRRFVDPAARFAFVDPGSYRPGPLDVRFDMFEGEFTHEGDRCTFEVLAERHAIESPALRALGEIVHDLDLKDGRFGRAEVAGLAPVIEGIVLGHSDDLARIEAASVVFDALYARLGQEASKPA